jgi:Glycosyl Hydrolase Family 88
VCRGAWGVGCPWPPPASLARLAGLAASFSSALIRSSTPDNRINFSAMLHKAALIAGLCVLRGSSAPSDPSEVAARAISSFLNFSSYSRMLEVTNYGPAIGLAAAYDSASLFSLPAIATSLETLLSNFASNATSTAFAVLHNISVPFGYSIGDTIGLMPLPYVAKAQYENIAYTPSDENWYIAETAADQYVIAWPLLLPDGTISRETGWETGRGASFLWCDDQFMGSALISALVRTPGFPSAKAYSYASFLGKNHLQFAQHMQRATGLYPHGYNDLNKDESCCVWGRANGWIMMAHFEVSAALRLVGHPLLPQVNSVWVKHAQALAALQDTKDGRWHQVLDDPTTFLETSVTAMTLFSLVEGVFAGVLDRATFTPIIHNAWKGIVAQVAANGTVFNICSGTGIGLVTRPEFAALILLSPLFHSRAAITQNFTRTAP